ncbi:hypothetical protein IWW38_003155 [Coemansia aciculifera]|uniref:Uncharacterized protein n=1 Tax=Coemansia aciculifera TaxID=417176 RepID=A0ACC1M297_9FUNG|nr:hypothetical protein IWW38_003155 [Coemansia aciculifera]
MPAPVCLQIIEREGGLKTLKVADITAMLRQHVLNKKVASRGEPMDVDALAGSDEDSAQVDALFKHGSRRSAKPAEQKTLDKPRVSRVPGYEIFKDWVTHEVYDQRAMDNVCLGCGKGHCWIKCSNYPKGQQK